MNAINETDYQSIKRIADFIIHYKLQSLAIFIIESHLPLAAIAHSTCLLLEPLTSPLFGGERITDLKILFSDPNHLRKLLSLLVE